MEKAYKNISLFFLAILCIVILGFFKTYFGLFPDFKNVTGIQHIHGLLFLLWFVMLIAQPVLISRKKLEWHRIVGKASYFLVPLIVISIFFIAKEMYDTTPAEVTQDQRISALYVPFYQIVTFLILYGLAIYYRKRVSYHMRFMIGTSLAVYGAALKRAFIYVVGMNGQDAFFYTFLLTDLILVGLLLYEWRNKKEYTPYTVTLLLMLLSQVGFYSFRFSDVWLTVCGKFVQLFY